MGSFNALDYTIDAFLRRESREYKSAKGRCSTDGLCFFSYQMAIARHNVRNRRPIVEILHEGRAPTQTTLRHLERLGSRARAATVPVETVYALGARLCPTCGERHGDREFYDDWGLNRARRTFASGAAVCAVRQALAAAEREAERLDTEGLVHRGIRYHAAVRDAKLRHVVGPTYIDGSAREPKCVVTRGVYVEPYVAAVLDLSIDHRLKRTFLARIGADPEFRAAVEALVVAPETLCAFAHNYLEAQGVHHG